MKEIRGGFRVDAYGGESNSILASGYAGLEVGLPWPLELTKEEKESAGYVWEWGVVAKIEFAVEYCRRAATRWPTLRILGIGSDECPGMISVPEPARFVGYDVVVTGGDYSLIAQDVLAERAAESSKELRQSLNGFGLFETRRDVDRLMALAQKEPENFDVLEGVTFVEVYWLVPFGKLDMLVSPERAFAIS